MNLIHLWDVDIGSLSFWSVNTDVLMFQTSWVQLLARVCLVFFFGGVGAGQSRCLVQGQIEIEWSRPQERLFSSTVITQKQRYQPVPCRCCSPPLLHPSFLLLRAVLPLCTPSAAQPCATPMLPSTRAHARTPPHVPTAVTTAQGQTQWAKPHL